MKDGTLGKGKGEAKLNTLKRFKLKNFQHGPAVCKYLRYLFHIPGLCVWSLNIKVRQRKRALEWKK